MTSTATQTKDVAALEPGDVIDYHGHRVTILTGREPHIDVTGLRVGRWLATEDTTSAHFGLMVFGAGATVRTAS